MKTESEKQMLILEGISGPVQLTLAGISGPIQVILPPQADDARVGYPLLEEDAMKRDLDLAKKIMLELEGW